MRPCRRTGNDGRRSWSDISRIDLPLLQDRGEITTHTWQKFEVLLRMPFIDTFNALGRASTTQMNVKTTLGGLAEVPIRSFSGRSETTRNMSAYSHRWIMSSLLLEMIAPPVYGQTTPPSHRLCRSTAGVLRLPAFWIFMGMTWV